MMDQLSNGLIEKIQLSKFVNILRSAKRIEFIIIPALRKLKSYLAAGIILLLL